MLVDAETFMRDREESGFRLLDLEPAHIFEASRLPLTKQHEDPFGRMLLAQATSEEHGARDARRYVWNLR